MSIKGFDTFARILSLHAQSIHTCKGIHFKGSCSLEALELLEIRAITESLPYHILTEARASVAQWMGDRGKEEKEAADKGFPGKNIFSIIFFQL